MWPKILPLALPRNAVQHSKANFFHHKTWFPSPVPGTRCWTFASVLTFSAFKQLFTKMKFPHKFYHFLWILVPLLNNVSHVFGTTEGEDSPGTQMHKIEGKVTVPFTTDQEWITNTRIMVDGGQHIGFLTWGIRLIYLIDVPWDWPRTLLLDWTMTLPQDWPPTSPLGLGLTYHYPCPCIDLRRLYVEQCRLIQELCLWEVQKL